ncbi:inositol monophosphatase family protein [Archaeoglobus profundus]|uniref:fructose-bisphosphatase n=1 Tax=Archaeoglobus profundus (strain DSM 5631 / JCM 9629 / NBRC 100127 / Av18) TaxID=572546 RepID=D2REP2_ARCPA|nr:inositol monophosphatase family protein [Archaeoglobus profundus]ADB58586.1 Inositol-phosphate phosphatase [Archaeoglobus profundus DSM 5631]
MTPKEALNLARKVGEYVKKEVSKIIGSTECGITVGIGKDGTPTKRIDIVAEKTALEILKESDVTVITEESGVVGSGDVIVSLDPIDGTFNAVKSIPIYSVSLCFSSSYYFRDVFCGYVLNLATGDEYYSINGSSYKNDSVIHVSNIDNLKEANVLFYYPAKPYPFKRIRILGSASLEICYVADGTFDAFIDTRFKRGKGFLRPFDVCSALFIAKNAGAKITDHRGNELNNKKLTMDERYTLLVSNPKLHEKLLKVIS